MTDVRFEVQNDTALKNIGFSINALSLEDGITSEYGEKGLRNFDAVTWPAGRRYLAMSGKLLCRATTSVNGSYWFHAIEQEKKGVA